MPPQIVIVTGPAEAASARELIRETGLNAGVIEAADETAVSAVQAAFEENAGVAVARGRLAAALKAQKTVPVVEAVLSAQDMADLLETACLLTRRGHPRVAFIGQRYMFSNPETFARILGAETDIYYIGEDGELTEVKNLPNNRIIDNQYKKMVIQKVNYLVGQPITFQSENKQFMDALKQLFGRKFMKLLKRIGTDAENEGIVWVFPTYDDDGCLIFKKFKGHEIIPGWRDADHTILDYAIRIYAMIDYSGTKNEQIVEKVEVYDETGISYFQLDGGHLTPEEPFHQSYFTVEGIHPFNWTKIPLIPFKRDADEIPLIRCCKSLQDGLNDILSNFENNMEG